MYRAVCENIYRQGCIALVCVHGLCQMSLFRDSCLGLACREYMQRPVGRHVCIELCVPNEVILPRVDKNFWGPWAVG